MFDTALISKRLSPIYFSKNVSRLNFELGFLFNLHVQKYLFLKKNKMLKI